MSEQDDKSLEGQEPKGVYDEDDDRSETVQIIVGYKHEATEARRWRMQQNDLNYDYYHLRANQSHKKKGQSVEFLPKMAMAVEQITSFLHQGLVDMGSWFDVSASRGNKNPLFTDSELKALTQKWLEDADFYTGAQDGIKVGLLGSVITFKVGTKRVKRPKYMARRKRAPLGYKTILTRADEYETQLDLTLVRQRDWYPDPTSRGLYYIEHIEMDLHELKRIARENPEDYDLEEIERMGAALAGGPSYQEREKSRETGQNPQQSATRLRVQIDECWGTLVNSEGEVVMENCVSAIANGMYLIRKPQPNPYWHQKMPYVTAPIIRVPHSEWHKSLMDAPMMLNRAANELFNLTLDSGLAAVFGVKQVRSNYIENADKLSGGIGPNEVIMVGPTCPPGVKAVETVSTSTGGAQEALAASNMVNAEFGSASLTNDLRMGVLPSRSVKATEVVESSNSITGTFKGISNAIENDLTKGILDLALPTMMQAITKFNVPEYVAVLGEDRCRMLDRASTEKRFSMVIAGHAYKVFGLTQTLNKIKDFRKITTFLQTIVQSPQLMDEFLKKYDLAKLLAVIMNSLDIDVDQIKLDEVDAMMGQMSQGGQPGAQAQAQPQGPDNMSQVPQMQASAPESALPGNPPQGGPAQ